MVEAARRRAAELGLDNVDFRVVDASAIELPDAGVDAALCRFGVMLVPDPAQALGEIARVLKPGGRTVLAVWAAAELNDWMTAAGRSALELGFVERDTPGEPGPFRLADPEELRRLVESTGLGVASLESVPVTWRAASTEEWWETVRDMSRRLTTLVEELTAEEVEALRAGAERRLAPYVAEDGSLEVPGRAWALLASR